MEDLPDEEKTTVYASGNYSVAGFWVKLERKVANHILQIIMPSGRVQMYIHITQYSVKPKVYTHYSLYCWNVITLKAQF